MRLMYIGMDQRMRVAEASRVKFLEDGLQRSDRSDEREEGLDGPVIVAHVYRSRGGKRLMMQVPNNFNMEQARRQLLEEGYLDLTNCPVKAENLY